MKKNNQNGQGPACTKCAKTIVGVSRYDVDVGEDGQETWLAIVAEGGKKLCGHCVIDKFLDDIREYEEKPELIKL